MNKEKVIILLDQISVMMDDYQIEENEIRNQIKDLVDHVGVYDDHMDIIGEVRKQLEAGSYYVEDYRSFNDLLEERGMSLNEYNDKITEVNHEIIADVPVIIYEDPESSLFNVAYITKNDTTESIINQLK